MNGGLRLLGVLLALLAGVRGQQPSIEVVLLGDADGGSVEFGKPFELEVVRRWPAGAVAEPWQDQALAPLVVTSGSVALGGAGGDVVETRRFRAFAFRRGAVTLQPGFGLVVAEGSPPVRATATPRALLVDSALPAGDDGRMEPPPVPPLRIVPMRRLLASALAWAAAAFAVGWLLLVLARALRVRQGARISPRARLLAQVEALVRSVPGTRAAERAEAVAATAIFRAAAQFAADVEPAGSLVHLALEQVKFAGRALSAAERAALIAELRRAVATVPETAGVAAPAAPRTGAA